MSAGKESAHRETRFLLEVGDVLASSLEYKATVKHIARLAVDYLAELCVVDVLDNDHQLNRVVSLHVDPAMNDRLQRVEITYPPVWQHEPSTRVIASRETLRIEQFVHPQGAHIERSGFLRMAQAFRTTSAVCVPMLQRQRLVGVLNLAAAHAFTDQDVHLAEELARRAGLALQNASRFHDAQRAVEIREEFLQLASHELRTPLTAMLLALQTLERTIGKGPPFAADRLERKTFVALEQAQRLCDLADSMIEATRISSGALTLDVGDADMVVLLRGLLERIDPLATARGCTVVLDPAPAQVQGCWDSSAVRQIVRGLLVNALRYGDGKPVEMGLEADDETVRITVRDHGAGMSAGDLQRIFQRFERLTSLRNFGGLGLGLYVSNALAKAHGGSLRAESALGAGTTFVVELPRRADATAHA